MNVYICIISKYHRLFYNIPAFALQPKKAEIRQKRRANRRAVDINLISLGFFD